MKFYDRKKELKILRDSPILAHEKGAQFTVLLGRRRIGKTDLLNYAYKNNAIYFFVAKKKSNVLLKEFGDILNIWQNDNRSYVSWDEFIERLFIYSIKSNITIIFDEFQNFKRIDESIFDIFQKNWDRYQREKGLNIIVAGSLITLLENIFYSAKEPLYKRATKRILLEEFNFGTVQNILKDNNRDGLINLLEFYTVFGGNPYYYNQIYKADVYGKSILDILKVVILEKNSILQNEGREILIQEFGTEHITYFSILDAVANGYNTFSKILNYIGVSDSILVRSLNELENNFRIIKKEIPIYGNNQKIFRYSITNNFFRFWFRYVYSYESFILAGRINRITNRIKKDIRSLCGYTFEKFCIEYALYLNDNEKFLIDFYEYGKWWNNTAEVDIIFGNKQKVVVAECKLSSHRINKSSVNSLVTKANSINSIKNKEKIFCFFCAEQLPRETINMLKDRGIYYYDSLK